MTGATYDAYGLKIRSGIEIPELRQSDFSSSVDVAINLGDVPLRLEPVDYEQHAPTARGENYLIISERRVLFHVDGIGRYLVEGGSQITIDPVRGATTHEVRVFLLGTCFGALLHQRGAFVLHASGFATENGAVLFAGRSGAGKSTLLAEFLRRGYRMLVDDVCAITSDERGLIVTPSYPRTRVWADTAAALSIDTTGLQRTLDEMEKFERQLPDQFWPTPSTPQLIYDLGGPFGDGVDFNRLSPMAGLASLLGNTYRKMMVDALGIRRRHFEMASALASAVPIVEVTRPVEGFHVAAMADRIVDDFDAITDRAT